MVGMVDKYNYYKYTNSLLWKIYILKVSEVSRLFI